MCSHRPHLVAPLSVVLLLGCASEADSPRVGEAPEVEPALAVGQGVVAFTALEQDRVEIVFGPQGGWHIEPAVRAWGLDAEGLILGYDLVDDQGVSVVFAVEAVLTSGRVRALDDGGWERVGDRLVLDITGIDEVSGRQFTLSLLATPVEGAPFGLDTAVTLVDEA